MLTIRQDDLATADVQALLALHLAGMQENTPPEHVFALDLSGLQTPDVTVWTVRDDGVLAGIGALKALDDGTGELKSMRTHPDHLRKGVAGALLDQILDEAATRGYRRVSLETGVGESSSRRWRCTASVGSPMARRSATTRPAPSTSSCT